MPRLEGSSVSASVFCPSCGFPNAPGFAFCTNCGRPMPPSAAAPPIAPVPPAYSPAYPAPYGTPYPAPYPMPYPYTAPRRATAGTFLSGTFDVWTQNFVAFFLVYLILGAITAAVGAGLSVVLLGTVQTTGVSPFPGTTTVPAAGWVAFIAYLIATAALSVFITSVVTGGMTEFAVRRFRGESMSLRQAFDRGVAKFLSILGANVLVTAIILALIIVPLVLLISSVFAGGGAGGAAALALLCGSLVALVVVGLVAIYLSVALGLYAPAIMMENARAVDGLSRSWRLMKGHWWSLFGALLVVGILGGIIAAAISVPANLTGNAALKIAASALASAIFGPLAIILAAVAYDLITKEGTYPFPVPPPFSGATSAAPPSPPSAPPANP